MIDDLVQRLRDSSATDAPSICAEAADEIERLRAMAPCYVVEYGAIAYPFGHPSRITSAETFPTLAQAGEFAGALEWNYRILLAHALEMP